LVNADDYLVMMKIEYFISKIVKTTTWKVVVFLESCWKVVVTLPERSVTHPKMLLLVRVQCHGMSIDAVFWATAPYPEKI